MSNPGLSPEQLLTLHRLADVLVPGVGDFPAASETDADGEVLDLAVAELSRDVPALQDLLDAASAADDPSSFVSKLKAEDAKGFERLWVFVVATYLSTPEVWKLLGYGGRVLFPVQPGEAEEFLTDDLLAPVLSRGKLYRPAPE